MSLSTPANPGSPDPDSTVDVDRAVCEIHAQCVYAAPAVFSLDEDDDLVYDRAPDARHDDAVRAAVAACPVQAIRFGGPT